jgi:dienelactone hydrolase
MPALLSICPFFFGEPGDDNPKWFSVEICVRREICLFAKGGGSPIVEWLRAFGMRLLALNGRKGIGVIGMCLSGNFAISLLADEFVLASVSSQPALPLGLTLASRKAIAVADSDLQQAKARNVSGASLMCLRFSNDRISPPERFQTIATTFAANFVPIIINSSPGNPDGISPKAHSVLTGDLCDKHGHPTRLARDQVIKFMKRHL